MKDKIIGSNRFHEIIKTRHVFTDNDQVFMKRDSLERTGLDYGEVWYPINFQWIPLAEPEQI